MRFSHCDPAGIVYYPRYLDLCNSLVEDWFTEGLALDYASIIMQRRLGLPTVHLQCDFRKPSVLGETLEMTLQVEAVGSSSVTLFILTQGADNDPRFAARIVLVCTSLESHRAISLPADIREVIDHYRSLCHVG
ncbi:acyl-CoA thioesterase [Aquibaculum arenosum]|uniref:Thioesterase family protein n=1 Tax=Aquibaculum arenosum TaxID=3032591 RepID=A0ABT5YNB4_9PROT|nr:thioesterase family protein [Fodinicurvata sp. CAU 1616]MDF2096327.1 thioesterase family protein [Fodinicurvata sp. CAU 1616]